MGKNDMFLDLLFHDFVDLYGRIFKITALQAVINGLKKIILYIYIIILVLKNTKLSCAASCLYHGSRFIYIYIVTESNVLRRWYKEKLAQVSEKNFEIQTRKESLK